jgi:hypothetical protein
MSHEIRCHAKNYSLFQNLEQAMLAYQKQKRIRPFLTLKLPTTL